MCMVVADPLEGKSPEIISAFTCRNRNIRQYVNDIIFSLLSAERYNPSKSIVVWLYRKNQKYNSRTRYKLVHLDLWMSLSLQVSLLEWVDSCMVWAILRKPLTNDTYNTTFVKHIFRKARNINLQDIFSPTRYSTRTQGKWVPLDLRMSSSSFINIADIHCDTHLTVKTAEIKMSEQAGHGDPPYLHLF